MALIDWLNSWDESKSIDWNQAKLVNWYLQANKRGKLPLAAYPTPGTTLFSSNSGSSCRGGFVYNEVPYVVIDSKLYSIASDGTKTELGTLTTSTGHLGMNKWAAITNQIIVIDGAHGYHYNTQTATFTQISDVDFPNTATSITAQDEYFLVSQPNSPTVTYSDISNGLSWNALNIIQKNRIAGNVTGVVASHGQVLFIAKDNIEPYFNSGAPFERSQDSLLYVGSQYVETCCVASDASVLMMVDQKGGGVRVVYAKQDQYASISDTIDYKLKTITTKSDAFAYIYEQEGQEFYVLTFPTLGITLVYNITTQSWHEMQSYVASAYTRHISNFIISCYGKIIIGDYQSGNLYYLDSDVYTENNTAIKRQLTTYPFYSEGKQVTGSRLEILFETDVGSNGVVDVSISKDSGHTFVARDSLTIGNAGTRTYLDRLGSSRQWVFHCETTMTNKCIMMGAIGDFRVGVN